MKRTVIVRLFIGLSLVWLAASGCSMNTIAVGVMDDILENGVEVMFEEDDVQLAEQAIAGNLKLLEALIRSDPGNVKVLTMAAQGYGGYALAFVEPVDPVRASKFYLRGKDYALQALRLKNHDVYKAMDGPVDDLNEALQDADSDDLPYLFWTAYNWGAYVNLNKNSVEAIGALPKVLALMNRIIELDPGYYYGGAHLFMGSYYSSLPRIMGGDPEKGKAHFEEAIALTDGKFLLTRVYYAQYYARAVFDQALYESILNEVLAEPDDLLPEQALVNTLAKERAAELLTQTEDYF